MYTSDQFKALKKISGKTYFELSQVINRSIRTLKFWSSGEVRIDIGLFELLMIRENVTLNEINEQIKKEV